VPAAVVTHLGGQSTGQIKSDSFTNLWASRYRFYRKHYGSLKVWLARHIVQVGMRRRAATDRAKAAAGQLAPEQLAGRLAAYRQVTNIWQGSSA
jgi:hypothetical protein